MRGLKYRRYFPLSLTTGETDNTGYMVLYEVFEGEMVLLSEDSSQHFFHYSHRSEPAIEFRVRVFSDKKCVLELSESMEIDWAKAYAKNADEAPYYSYAHFIVNFNHELLLRHLPSLLFLVGNLAPVPFIPHTDIEELG